MMVSEKWESSCLLPHLCFVTELNLPGRAKQFKQLVQMTKKGMEEKV